MSSVSTRSPAALIDDDLQRELELLGVSGPAASGGASADPPPPYSSATLHPSRRVASSVLASASVSHSAARPMTSSRAVPASIRAGGSVNPELMRLEAEQKALEQAAAESARRLAELEGSIDELDAYGAGLDEDSKMAREEEAENKKKEEEDRRELRRVAEQARLLKAEKDKLMSEKSKDVAEIARLNRKNAEDEAKMREAGAVDVAIVMDVTSSMHHCLAAAQSKMDQVVGEVARMQGLTAVRFAFVGYRDWFDTKRFEEVPFTENVHSFMSRVRSIAVAGGGDIPEDVLGGLDRALDLDWRAKTKLIILVADAPCHGEEYHTETGLDDDKSLRYMAEGRDLLDPASLLVAMRTKKIDFVATQINSSTQVCFDKFKKMYDDVDRVRTMKIIPLSATAEDFVPRISASISNSIAASRHGAVAVGKLSTSSRSVFS